MSTLRRALSLFGWTRHSSILLGGFLLTIFLIVYIWWPLAEEVLSYVDWNGPWFSPLSRVVQGRTQVEGWPVSFNRSVWTTNTGRNFPGSVPCRGFRSAR